MTYTVTAQLSTGLTLNVEFVSKAAAEHAAAHLVADYAAEGVTAAVVISIAA